MDEQTKPETFPLNIETIDVLVTNVIPTTKYFEVRFDNIQLQFNQLKDSNEQRFAQIDQRF